MAYLFVTHDMGVVRGPDRPGAGDAKGPDRRERPDRRGLRQSSASLHGPADRRDAEPASGVGAPGPSPAPPLDFAARDGPRQAVARRRAQP
ncbi:hypothetical protein ACRAWD_20250 [Caulobacter segnis]